MAIRSHFSLTASTASSVTITAPADTTTTFSGIYNDEDHRIRRRITRVTIINHGTDAVYYRWDGTNPTDGGADDDWVVLGGTGFVHEPLQWESKEIVFISAGTPDVSIIAEA